MHLTEFSAIRDKQTNVIKTCTYLQVVVHEIQRQDQQSILCSVWSQKDLHGTLHFVA